MANMTIMDMFAKNNRKPAHLTYTADKIASLIEDTYNKSPQQYAGLKGLVDCINNWDLKSRSTGIKMTYFNTFNALVISHIKSNADYDTDDLIKDTTIKLNTGRILHIDHTMVAPTITLAVDNIKDLVNKVTQ